MQLLLKCSLQLLKNPVRSNSRISSRNLSRTLQRNAENVPQKPVEKVAAEHPSKNTFRARGLDRRILVWSGYYKTVDEVPSYVSGQMMEKAKNKVRIKLNIMMMVAAAIGCVVMVYSGKAAAARGESVTKQNLEWHRKIKEESEK